jgi:hypothetical protein
MTARPKRRQTDGVEIRAVPIGKLHQADWNPRSVEQDRMESLKRSIQSDPDLLWQRPILALTDGTVYAGNQRLEACRQLGWDTVPAMLEDVPEQVMQERSLRDNSSWGEWNDDVLATLLGTMPEERRVDLGFTDADVLARLKNLPTIQPPQIDEDDDSTYVQNEHGKSGKTPDELMGGWTEGVIRNVVLYYEPAEYDRVNEMLTVIRDQLNVESNADAVAVALEEAYAHYCASAEGTEPG